MNKYISLIVGGLALASSVASANSVELSNFNPDPNGDPWIANLPELTPEQKAMLRNLPQLEVDATLPASIELSSNVDNSQNIHFRPIFNQTSGSCGQASGIGYTYTYEMAVARNVDASLPENQYPEHFTWNFLNRGTKTGSWYFDGWNIVRDNGAPNVQVYGGMASADPHTQWMSGYDKYYQGMFNRNLGYNSIDVSTPEGIETMKHWIDHHADGSAIGGVVNFACNAYNTQDAVLEADSAHAGETIIKRFGDSGYHAMTFVGYDDDVKVDINGDGQYTNDLDLNEDGVVNVRDWEIGAVKVANSWGTGWGNSGFKWVSYSVLSHDLNEGGITWKNVYALNARETYTPRMTLKARIVHDSRGKIRLKAGVASSFDAVSPEHELNFDVFNYQGGDHPMRGDSIDPIEIGLDVSPLLDMIGPDNAKKFFLIVDENDYDNVSSGEIVSVSAIDYINDEQEFIGANNTSIINNDRTLAPIAMIPFVCEEFDTTNTQHETAARAYSVSETTGETCYGTFCFGGTTTTTWYANGSDDNLGTSGSTQIILHTEPQDIFAKGICAGPDITAPVMTILGDSPMVIVMGTDFVDPGATAEDDRDGDLTTQITVTGSVNSTNIGAYSLTYSVSDAARNNASVTRTVEVIAPPACEDFSDTVANHESATRAYSVTETTGETCYGTFCFGGTTTTTWYAQGSDENLGTNSTAVVILRTNPNSEGFVTGDCPAEQQAPNIDSVNVAVNGNSVTISGTASDADGDLNAIVLYFQGGGVQCQGLENWTCPVMQGLQPGEHLAQVKAVDSRIVDSEHVDVPFTIAGPQAPTIDSYEANVYQKQLVVTGAASDVDGDLVSVKINNDIFGEIECSDTAEFYCNVYDLVPGETYNFYLVAQDALGNTSEQIDPIIIVMPESNPPVIESWTYEISNRDLIVSGVSSDVDNDILNTVLYLSGGGITCEGIEQWSCVIPNIQPGTHNFAIKTSDGYLNDSGLIEFEVVVEDSSSAPTIDTHEYTVSGNTITFTGTASDVDGDLDRVLITLGAAGAVLCEGTANFTCVWEAPQAGTYGLGVVAVDAMETYGEVAGPYDIVIVDQGECITDTNFNHVEAARAYVGGLSNLYAYGVGSDDDLGLYGSTYYSVATSLEETSAGVWAKVTSCP